MAPEIASLSHITLKQYAEGRKNHRNKKDIIVKMLQSPQHTAMVLLQHPLAFCNAIAIVTEAQQMFLNIYGFLDFVEIVLPCTSFPTASYPVRSDWMGCFTQNTTVYNELFCMGVPVWFIHSNFTITDQTIIEMPVTFSFPNHIVRAMYSEHGKTVQPFNLLYCGGGGLNCHVHLHQYYMGHVEPSLSTLTSTMPSTSNVCKAPTHTQTRKADQKCRSCQQQRQSSKCHHFEFWPCVLSHFQVVDLVGVISGRSCAFGRMQ